MRKAHVVKRSIFIAGHKTSVSLEDAFWSVLKDAATNAGRTLGDLVAEIDDARSDGANLSSCLRLFALQHVRSGACV